MASTAAAIEAADVDVEHPVHVPRHQRLIQGRQCLVGAAGRAEPPCGRQAGARLMGGGAASPSCMGYRGGKQT